MAVILKLDDVKRILALQSQAYELFLWIKESLKWGTLEFKERHLNQSPENAMRNWIGANKKLFPDTVQVDELSKDDFVAFSNLVLSFPIVSFEPKAGGELIDGCSCGMCAVYSQKHFKPKQISHKDNLRADAAVVLCLQTCAESVGLTLSTEEAKRFLQRFPIARRSAYLATYVADLDRRTRFEVQSSEGLVLWRRLKSGTRKKLSPRERLLAQRRNQKTSFKIEAAHYMTAIEHLRDILREFSSDSAHS